MLPEFPSEAQQALDIIRRDVKRPRAMPKAEFALHEDRPVLRWTFGDKCMCPMGLHPSATSDCPDSADGFVDMTYLEIKAEFSGDRKAAKRVRRLWRAVKEFGKWFDSIEPTKENAKLVMKFIWPPKRKRK
jgi:hypothetical protein